MSLSNVCENPTLTVESLQEALQVLADMADQPIALHPADHMVLSQVGYQVIKKREKTFARRNRRHRHRDNGRYVMNIFGYLIPRG